MTSENPSRIQPLTLKAMHRLLTALELRQIIDVRIDGESLKWVHSEFANHDVVATIADPMAHTVSVTVDGFYPPDILPWSAVLMDSTNEVFDN